MSKFFSDKELKCKCSECLSSGHEMDERFMQKMDDIREQCGFALIVSSAYRCPLYNDRVSATGKSGPHTTGRAMDIAVSHENAFIFLNAALENGITGIGIQQKGKIRFIHVDDLTNPYPRPRVWSY